MTRIVGKIYENTKEMTQAQDPKQCVFTNLGCKLEPRREGLVESIWESCGGIQVASWRHLEASWKHLGGTWRHLGGIGEASTVGFPP